MLRSYWYFVAVTWAYSASTFDLAVFIYRTYSDSDFSEKSKIIWSGRTDWGLDQFLPMHRVYLRKSADTIYPATDVTFSGLFVMPHYIDNLDTYYFYFGTYDGISYIFFSIFIKITFQ